MRIRMFLLLMPNATIVAFSSAYAEGGYEAQLQAALTSLNTLPEIIDAYGRLAGKTERYESGERYVEVPIPIFLKPGESPPPDNTTVERISVTVSAEKGDGVKFVSDTKYRRNFGLRDKLLSFSDCRDG